MLPVLVIAAWSGFFIWSRLDEILMPATPARWSERIALWSPPVLLVCTIWLLAMRLSRREASRFGDAARLLRQESELLEARLASVNSELSIAREFMAAQSRDLESLGRIAAERLSGNAETLAGLIHSNGAQIDAIGSVSTTALENMEQLRGHLPVIASSARDVTNNIGNAGRTAHAQLNQMIQGFKRLNDFGQASERQVASLRERIDEALAAFSTQADHLEEISRARFDELAKSSEAFRTHLDTQEVKVLAAIRSRTKMLDEELRQASASFEEQERASLEALRARLDAISHEATGFSDSLRESLASFDAELSGRQASHKQQTIELAAHAESVTSRLSALTPQLAEIGNHASSAGQRLSEAMTSLAGTFQNSQEALAGTEAQLAGLTDASVRLLEIIQASMHHSRDELPKAISASDSILAELETRVLHIRSAAQAAGEDGKTLLDQVESATGRLEHFRTQTAEARAFFSNQEQDLAEMLSGLRQQLEEIAEQGSRLAGTASGELSAAVARLSELARETLHGIESMSDDAMARLASRLGDASRKALDQAIDSRMSEAVGEIGKAAASASEIGRETAVQLRDQLAKVNELAGNLEQRIAHARSRAEEQVNNDFSRRVALITESLNSNAIDIARALSSDVSDTAWAAYLKGDRGIFTRRTVSLIEAGETRSIMNLYETDAEFREHVSRYIHDFEAMLRQVLSTRDGHALGVTLLSSDIGKLYVAMAQAIERLRS